MLHLVTDSTAYLPTSLIEQWDIRSVPLKIIINGQSVNETELPQEEFLKLLASLDTTPSTSQPAVGEFEDMYRELTANPDDEVVSIHISSKISGTYVNALAAAERIESRRITVMDSLYTTAGLGLMVIAAAQAREVGKSRAEIAAIVERMSRETASIFVVDDLEYLRKGGRINTAAKLLGSLLNIKPLLTLDEGAIKPLDKVRTKKRAVKRMLDEIEKRVGRGPVRMAATHVAAPEDVEIVAALVRERFEVVHFFICETGPAIGAHVGPGLLALGACPVGEDGF